MIPFIPALLRAGRQADWRVFYAFDDPERPFLFARQETPRKGRRMTTVMPRPAALRERRSYRVYLPIALTCLAIAIVGFWPTYFGPLLAGVPHALPIIHLHAIVFTGWLLLLIAQIVLIARGRVALHMKVGKFGFAWGIVVMLVGWITAFSRFADRIHAGNFAEAQSRLFAPFTDMFFFAPFLAAAWIYRRKSEIHKRLIVVASTILLIAAVHRITFLGGSPPPAPQLLMTWLSPIALGMIYDYYKRRLVHPVYLLGIGVVLLMKFGRAPLRHTKLWENFTSWLVTFYVSRGARN